MTEIMQRYDAAMELHEAGNTDEAIVQLEAIVKDDPNFALAHNALGVFYGRKEDFDRALEHASRVCELEPNDAFSFVAQSIAAIGAGQSAVAEEARAKAQEIQWAEIRKQFEEAEQAKEIADAATDATDAQNTQNAE